MLRNKANKKFPQEIPPINNHARFIDELRSGGIGRRG